MIKFWCTVVILKCLTLASILPVNAYGDKSSENYENSTSTDCGGLRLWLTISAGKQNLEISWENAPAHPTDYIILTQNEPSASGVNDIIVGTFTPDGNSSQWVTTNVVYDYALSSSISINTTCYGYWAAYKNSFGEILATTCLRAYPRWMNDLRPDIDQYTLLNLFVPGTHDSGAYIPGFKPQTQENVLTKFLLTQDEDIRGQLMHGVRYLDIRVGYYPNSTEKFFINHGLSRIQPLLGVIEQVKKFVLETNEVVIFGLKEFPIGFQNNSAHRLLVQFLKNEFGSLLVIPSNSWNAWNISLNEIWSKTQRVLLAYDHNWTVMEYNDTLFDGVDQRWGNVQNWNKLERHLRSVNSLTATWRPVADMAELTPKGWDIIFGRSLRQMSDNINWRISRLYRKELGRRSNIVAVDFMRGTTIMELAILLNKEKLHGRSC